MSKPDYDIKELRIGNWLMFNGHTPSQVQTIDILDRSVNFLSADDDDMFDAIPLTHELLLLKCGFQIFYYHAFSLIDKEVGDFTLRLKIKKGVNTFLLVGNGGYDESGEMDITGVCKHLHQLQNLYFSLTGLELEINLP